MKIESNSDFFLFSLIGCEVIVLCEHGNGEQRRKHRKRRINKKWLKRYGVWTDQPLDKDRAIFVEGENRIYTTRAVYRKLKSGVTNKFGFLNTGAKFATGQLARSGPIGDYYFSTRRFRNNRLCASGYAGACYMCSDFTCPWKR